MKHPLEQHILESTYNQAVGSLCVEFPDHRAAILRSAEECLRVLRECISRHGGTIAPGVIAEEVCPALDQLSTVRAIPDIPEPLQSKIDEARGFFLRCFSALDHNILAEEVTHNEAQLAATSFTHAGFGFGNQRRYTESVAAYSESIALVPDNVKTWSNRGYILMIMGDLDAAVRNFEEGMVHVDAQLQSAKDPDISLPLKSWYLNHAGHFLSNYANALFRRGDYEASIRISRDALLIKGMPPEYAVQMRLHIHNALVMIRQIKRGGQDGLIN